LAHLDDAQKSIFVLPARNRESIQIGCGGVNYVCGLYEIWLIQMMLCCSADKINPSANMRLESHPEVSLTLSKRAG
jgi:hypothetical protein